MMTSFHTGYGWRTSAPTVLKFLAISGYEDALDWYEKHEQEAGHAYAFSKDAFNVWTVQ